MTKGHATTEALLGRFACKFTYEPALPLERIDRLASVTNQSRFEPIHEPTVERYVAALEEGAEFPPVIVRVIPVPKSDPQLVTLGGNHRERAHIDAGRKTIAAYVVTCDDTVALEIAYADNATHGLPPTKAEQIAHALLLVNDHGRSMAHAARVVGINAQQITKHAAAEGVRTRARKCGVAVELAKVSEGVVPRLASLRDDRVFTKFIRAVTTNGIPTPRAMQMIGDINAQKDVAGALDILGAHVRDHRATADSRRHVGRPSTNPILVLRTALGSISGLAPADIADLCTAHDRAELHKLLVAGGRQLMAIDKHLQGDARHLEAVR